MSGAEVKGRALDVRELPTVVFGHRSLMWWGTLGFMVVEATVFALALMAYFYLRSHQETWPLTAPPPDLLWGTLNTVVMLVSFLPAHLAKKAAEHLQLKKVRLWLVVSCVFGIAFCVIRGLEFATLNVRWDSSAYGSVVWLLLGLHTTHIVTDLMDTIVLTVMFFTGPLDGKRYVDVSENSFYWYFVVAAWIPIYLVIYFGARTT
ncbi:cytochrome c oxidase subunit 3 [Ramlibacter sp. USB13]|uniref:Cytochrome c oxidase subunit 3 n=1 Tax=Ramlibacter cellulosilyticus TaxID=2764187 RepID=A0A923MW25_9BURK|nr:cytochrome c oxidase subunit 3 [Ramlibacter cellulosilyticus]MBC5786338.1 cytochrome c oxidase subunit 3 [Ramlibacter cellulosilyticus]